MRVDYFQKQMARGMKRYFEKTGLVPHIYALEEHDSDPTLVTIHFCRDTEYTFCGYTKSAFSPHLYYSFSPSRSSLNSYRWDGLKRWQEKRKNAKA